VVALDAPSDSVTFTLAGRIQTRLFLILLIALPWTAILSPLLPVPPGTSIWSTYRLTYSALLIVAVVGVAWDFLYHGLQQLRWDKDWPSLFALLAGINEGASTWLGLHVTGALGDSYGLSNPMATAFAIHFATTWLLMWLVAQGPLRVLMPRWRFRGGRVTGWPVTRDHA
jgi:hypothetical protein